MRGREGQRGGHAVAQQLVEEHLGHLARMRRRRRSGLVREGVVLQPGQQAFGWRADDVGLREMDVHVDEARRDDAARASARRRHPGWRARHRAEGAGVQHALAAGGVGPDHQQAVFVVERLAVGVESQKGGAVGFHGLKA